ncbi:MAG: hypothetical protein HY363_03380 [Candidatus Aenigmarchaeota archaeon]|nr:hypothetical protein [Candidatus Aenigmarchaeota archaeon]
MIFIADENALIARFVEQYTTLKTALADEKLSNAMQQYKKLLELYQIINNSSLGNVHKEMAYQQILNCRHDITQLHNDSTNSTNYVAIAVVLIIVSTVIFINPNLVGLAVLNTRQTETVEIGVSFIETSQKQLTLKTPPSAVFATGKVTGHGKAQLYLIAGDEKRLIFDNQLVPLVNGTFFSDICLDTCQLSNTNKYVTLQAELSDTILTIDSISYDPDTNRPPEYIAPSRNIVVSKTTTFNLKDYFKDPDGDTMAFVVLPADGLQTQLVGAMLTITPEKEGNYELPIIASDPKESTRIILGISK